jgi:hypothetical protein
MGSSTKAQTTGGWNPSFLNTANKKTSKISDQSTGMPYRGQIQHQNYVREGPVLSTEQILNTRQVRPLETSEIPYNLEQNYNLNPNEPCDFQNYKDFIVSDTGTIYKKHVEIVHENGKPSLKFSYLPLSPYKEEVIGQDMQVGFSIHEPQPRSNYGQGAHGEDAKVITDALVFHANLVKPQNTNPYWNGTDFCGTPGYSHSKTPIQCCQIIDSSPVPNLNENVNPKNRYFFVN